MSKANCIYKKGKDVCTSSVAPNCSYFKVKRLKDFGDMRIQVCSYKETDKPLVSYRINSNRAYAERRSKDNDG